MITASVWFNIMDYTGSATRMFADPDFDGDPVLVTETEIDSAGEPKEENVIEEAPVDPENLVDSEVSIIGEPEDAERRKFNLDNDRYIAAHFVLRARSRWQAATRSSVH